MLTLNEKLDLISDLEEARFKPDVIDTIVESMEFPENLNGPFETLDEFYKHLDNIPDDEEINDANS